ncbi:hypothetical protein F4W09_02170 [Acinetobacter tandoii]|uniref:Uncharacterized protein n=2 Tax=Acinetobacter tandoii TaxID=202954 RepID=A0A5N4WUL1_9GAMM|nr:hypothetical protein F4W09_02170 [Acinetobacter tandoii]
MYSKAKLSFFGNPSELASESWHMFNQSMRLSRRYPDDEEFYLRRSLDHLLNCFWYYQNSRVGLSILMHAIGRYLNINHGCPIDQNIGYHRTQCPNMLLHLDFGFSIRAKEKYICSICLSDPLDCIHRAGRIYDDVKCQYFMNQCNICGEAKDNCKHVENILYNQVLASNIVSAMDIITWDIVSEPLDVFTRIYDKPIYPDEIYKEHYGVNWKDFYGNLPLNCDHCLTCHKYDPNKNKKIKKLEKLKSLS